MFYEKLRKLHNYHKIHKPFPFTNPVSTTYLTPGIVIDVSAMFVARITFRFPRGAEMNTFIWCCDGKAANMGHTRSSGHSVNRKEQHIIPLNRCSSTISKNPLLLYRKHNKLDFKVKDLSIIFVMESLKINLLLTRYKGCTGENWSDQGHSDSVKLKKFRFAIRQYIIWH